MRNIAFKYPWVFYLDADERSTPELQTGLHVAVAQPGDAAAFRIERRDIFRGRWLKHAQSTSRYIRLFRPERMRYERLVNPVSIVDGPVGEAAGHLLHYPFSKGLSHWIARHNSYSSFEAAQIVANRASRAPFSLWRALFSSDFNERRFHQKEVFYRLPMHPLVKFLYLYVLKRGFLDGRAGFTYAALVGMYEYFIVLKTRELESRL